MSTLTAKERKFIPKKDFGLPSKVGTKGKDKKITNQAGDGAYPMPDRRHAALAKSFAKTEEKKGKLSKAAEEKIDRKADRKLGETFKGRIESSTDGKSSKWSKADEKKYQHDRKRR